MKKTMKFFAVFIMLLVFYTAAYPINGDAGFVPEFKRSGVYSQDNFFDDAYVLGQGNLVVIASQKFMAQEQDKKDDISREAVDTWKLISGKQDRIVYVEIREGDKKTVLWESKGSETASIAEQWGQQRKPESGLNVFLSGGVNGSFESIETMASAAYATVGTYFFNNMFDSAINISYSKGGGSAFGLSGRVHFLLDPKWDFNLGLQGNSTGGVFDLSGLIGFSNFIAYRSSLDLTLSLGTSGIVTLGAGITHYFDDSRDLEITPGVNRQSVYNKIEQDFTAISTPSKTYSSMAANTPWPTSTTEPTPLPTPTSGEEQAANEIPAPPHGDDTKDLQLPDDTASVESTPTPVVTETEKKETQKELEERMKKEIRNEFRNEQTQKTPAIKKNGTTAGIFIEADLMSIARSITNNWIDWNARFGFGDDGNFGMCFILDGIYYDYGRLRGLEEDLDLAFDIYPFGHSPSGFYIGPVIGAGFNSYRMQDYNLIFINLSAGAEAGVRLLMNWFILDAGFAFTANVNCYNTGTHNNNQVQYNGLFRAGAGVMFYASDNGDKKTK